MPKIELSIDLGSSFINIYQKGIGLVLREPSVAVFRKARNRVELREVGYRAGNIISSSLGGATVVSPVKEGIIVDPDLFILMMKHLINRITPKTFVKPKVTAIVAITCSMTNSDRLVVEKCMLKSGISEVTLVESPLCLLAFTKSIGGLFVDVGSSKTEIAAVTNRGIIVGSAVNIAGDALNKAIIDSVYINYGVKLGEHTIENLKKSALSLYTNDNTTHAVSGGSRNGSPKSLSLSTSDMREAILPLIDDIIEVIVMMLNQTPPELSAEILRKGIFISGGTTHMPGFVPYIEQALELPVTLLGNPDSAVAIGGGEFITNKELLGDLLNIKLD